jgi:hypothetical protein
MYGNTHAVAEHIAKGFGDDADVKVVPVERATRELVDAADLLVVGGPTHAHGMSSSMTRRSAVEDAQKKEELHLDPDAEGPGLRDWFHDIGGDRHGSADAASFDTRFDASPALTGRASKGIARRLHHHGFKLVIENESFLVDKHNQLLANEEARAEAWGRALRDAVTSPSARR